MQLRESRTIFETDHNPIPKGGKIEERTAAFIKATKLAGITDVCEELEGYLLGAGFVSVKVVVKKLPVGNVHGRKIPRKRSVEYTLASVGALTPSR